MDDYQIIIHVDVNDPLNSVMERCGAMMDPIFEYKLYQPLTQKKYFYRMDKSSNSPGQQRHIHMYYDDEGRCQAFAMNVDGTPHDGSKFIIPKKLYAPLQKFGLTIPPGGILEYEN